MAPANQTPHEIKGAAPSLDYAKADSRPVSSVLHARPASAPAGGTPTAAMHRKQCLRGRSASLDARRVPASAALARTTGVPLRGSLRRFGVLHALLGGHPPHDER